MTEPHVPSTTESQPKNSKRLLFAVLALLPVALFVLWMVRRPAPVAQPVPAPAAAPATVAATAPSSASLVEAQKAHAKLMAEAEAVPVPSVMPVPQAAAGVGNDLASAVQTAPAGEPGLPAVDRSQQVAIAFTGNVVGETDPCG